MNVSYLRKFRANGNQYFQHVWYHQKDFEDHIGVCGTNAMQPGFFHVKKNELFNRAWIEKHWNTDFGTMNVIWYKILIYIYVLTKIVVILILLKYIKSIISSTNLGVPVCPNSPKISTSYMKFENDNLAFLSWSDQG